jgi:hypothetical protein
MDQLKPLFLNNKYLCILSPASLYETEFKTLVEQMTQQNIVIFLLKKGSLL